MILLPLSSLARSFVNSDSRVQRLIESIVYHGYRTPDTYATIRSSPGTRPARSPRRELEDLRTIVLFILELLQEYRKRRKTSKIFGFAEPSSSSRHRGSSRLMIGRATGYFTTASLSLTINPRVVIEQSNNTFSCRSIFSLSIALFVVLHRCDETSCGLLSRQSSSWKSNRRLDRSRNFP